MYESLSLLFTPTTERHNFTEIKQAKSRGVLENLHYYTIICNWVLHTLLTLLCSANYRVDHYNKQQFSVAVATTLHQL